MPWTSAGSRAVASATTTARGAGRTGSAASAHWTLRCEVGATTTSRRRRLAARSCTAAHRAKVVLPAPGVATARKSGASAAASRSRARFCHGRRRTLRAMGADQDGTAAGGLAPHGRSARCDRPSLERNPTDFLPERCRSRGVPFVVGASDHPFEEEPHALPAADLQRRDRRHGDEPGRGRHPDGRVRGLRRGDGPARRAARAASACDPPPTPPPCRCATARP